jgi:hypothetical protein
MFDENGNQSYFDTTLTRIAGILNVRDTLFVASNQAPYVGLVAYSLHTDEMLFYLPIASTGLLNDLDYDNHGNIYISDYWDNKLFKVDMSTLSCSLFVDPIQAPNGVLCDTLNNRLLVISVVPGLRPLLAVDLSDGSQSVIVNTYSYAGDGIARDSQNRIYVSEWSTNSCHRYDTLFSHPPQTVSTGHHAPADIYINQHDNILCVPNFYRNDVDFVALEQSSAPEITIPERTMLIGNYPNPFNSATTIEYSIINESLVTVDIYDILGSKIETVVNDYQQPGRYQTVWHANDISSGVYFCKIATSEFEAVGKMVFLK